MQIEKNPYMSPKPLLPEMEPIKGIKNPIYRLLQVAKSAEGRKKHGVYIINGPELVKRALQYGQCVESVILSNTFTNTVEGQKLRILAQSQPVYEVSPGWLGKAIGSKPLPKCLAIAKRKLSTLEELLSTKELLLMVDDMENIDNLGMLLRSTDATGVGGVLLTGKTPDPFHQRTVRGSRGAVFSVPICMKSNSLKVLHEARKKGFQIVATSANEGFAYTELDYQRPTIVIVGNEHTGISQDVLVEAHQVANIPMAGQINSLNVSVAASVMLYEAVRQRSV